MAADKELNIHLKTTADPAGVNDVEKGMEDVGKAGVEAAQDIKEADDKVQRARRESAAQSQRWIEEWKQESLQAAQAAEEAIRGVEAEARRAAAAAEAGAAAGVQGVNLQKAQQLKELAAQAKEIGDRMKEALDSVEDGTQSTVEQFDKVAAAGASAAGGIAAGFLAFGPTGAVVVAALAGLRLIAQQLAENRKEAEAMIKAQQDAYRATQEAVDKAMGRDGLDITGVREDIETRRQERLAEIQREAERARRNADTARERGDLSDNAPDGPDKATRMVDREATARLEKQEAERRATAARLAAEEDARQQLEARRKELSEQTDAESIRLRNSVLGQSTRPEDQEEVKRQADEIGKMREEVKRLDQQLKASEARARQIRAEQQDREEVYTDTENLSGLRDNNRINTAQERELQRQQADAKRRQAAQEALDRQGRTGPEVDRLARNGGTFADKGDSRKFQALEKAAKAFEDGATSKEIEEYHAAVMALFSDVSGMQKNSKSQWVNLRNEVEALRKTVKAGRE